MTAARMRPFFRNGQPIPLTAEDYYRRGGARSPDEAARTLGRLAAKGMVQSKHHVLGRTSIAIYEVAP